MKKLSLQDAAFLQVETEDCPAHVAGLQIFQLPKSHKGSFFRRLMERFDHDHPVASPFNWKLHSDVLKLDVWPSWVEDDHFDLDYHVRYSALPSPGTMDQLMKLVERLHSRLLDRTRPLWECYMIEGLEGNRVAIYFKVHHSAIDGVAGMQIMDRALQHKPNSRNVRALWQMEQPKKQGEDVEPPSVLDQITQSYSSILGQARSITELSTNAFKSSVGALAGIDRKAPMPFTGPDTPFNSKITRHRRFATNQFSLSRIKAIAKDLDVTINDVVLTMCSGALRHYLKHHDALPDRSLTAAVPVSIRPKENNDGGNMLSMVTTTLATDEDNPITRVRRINASMVEAKDRMSKLSKESATNYALVMNSVILLSQSLGLGNTVAPPMNLVISNVPGPRHKLYLMDAELIHNYPMSVLVHGQALNMTVTSYDDSMDFGLLGAREVIPDIDRLAQGLDRAADELEAADEHMLEEQVEAARAALAARRAAKQVRAAAKVGTPKRPKKKAATRKTRPATPKKAPAKRAKPKSAAKKSVAKKTPKSAGGSKTKRQLVNGELAARQGKAQPRQAALLGAKRSKSKASTKRR